LITVNAGIPATLVGFLDNELAELGRRAAESRAAEFAESCLHLRIGESGMISAFSFSTISPGSGLSQQVGRPDPKYPISHRDVAKRIGPTHPCPKAARISSLFLVPCMKPWFSLIRGVIMQRTAIKDFALSMESTDVSQFLNT
jgi:hypothetical protein